MDNQRGQGERDSIIQPPQTAAEVRTRHETNREGWNHGADLYAAMLDESLASLRAGHSNLHPVERANLARLGPLSEWCQTAIHLQCASGYDTLSLWLEGVAQVVGVDIADKHIENARQLSRALNAPARWYRCDVLDTPHELDGTADLVYTGQGALCWIHDLTGWAATIHRLLKPGGVVHLLDDHPFTWMFDQETETLTASNINYFAHAQVFRGWPGTYLGEFDVPLSEQSQRFERLWPLSSVFQALSVAGLTVEFFGEHTEEFWDPFPNLKPEFKARIPMTFSMLARRPPAATNQRFK